MILYLLIDRVTVSFGLLQGLGSSLTSPLGDRLPRRKGGGVLSLMGGRFCG